MRRSSLKKLLQQGAGEWNAWREEHRETPIDLSGIDLSGLDLRDVDLGNAQLYRL